MVLFVKSNKLNSLPKLNVENAMVIYELLKVKDANRIFLEDNIATEYTEQVIAEMKRLENEIISKVNGGFILEKAIPAVYDEEGIVISNEIPAVVYKITSKAQFLIDLNSDLLNSEKVCSDVEDYYSDYKQNRSFTDFKNLVLGV